MTTYRICETRKRNWSVSDASSGVILRTKMEATLEYLVIAENLAEGQTPADISDSEVCQLPELPKVNGSSYIDPVDSTVRPFMLCKSKSCTRNPSAPHVFNVTAKFEEIVDGRENPGMSCPNDPTDIRPQVSYQILETEKVLYTDLQNEPKDCFILPGGLGEPYEAPVIQKVPELLITITQYEFVLTAQQMLDRSFKCNMDQYRGKNADHWMIGAVSAKEVEVSTCNGKQAWVQVTYPIKLSDYFVTNYVAGGPTEEEPGQFFVGHQTAMPLISNYHMQGGEKIRFADEGSGYGSVGFVEGTTANSGGVPGAALSEQTKPNYEYFQSVPRIMFSSFLQI